MRADHVTWTTLFLFPNYLRKRKNKILVPYYSSAEAVARKYFVKGIEWSKLFEM
jgi:hypothetical protein